MSPAPSDALLGTKPESLLGTSPSKLSRQTGASHSVLVHSVNEDGTTQVGCLRFLCSVLETYSRLETACVSCKPTVGISSLRRCCLGPCQGCNLHEGVSLVGWSRLHRCCCGPFWIERCMCM